ncbi:hypothetical protein DF19_04220 [Streptomyces olindensis]|nr:hypothetical protein DF19_04220 [Streptomyces olindensis]
MIAPEIAVNRACAAARPTCSRFMSTLVSGGREADVRTRQSSKPITATSSGTRWPRSRRTSMTPRAIWSLPHSTASTSGCRSSSSAVAARPQPSDHAPNLGSPTRARPASASAARAPSARSRAAAYPGSPVMCAMRWWR